VTITCSYGQVDEVDGNLTGMLAAKGITTLFDVKADSAPIIYVHGQPARTASAVRTMERTAAGLTADDLATGQVVRLTNYLADPVEMNLLHMITGDPKRTAAFALFANPDFYLSSGSASCGSSCVSEPSAGGVPRAAECPRRPAQLRTARSAPGRGRRSRRSPAAWPRPGPARRS
jgi:hypothetical protein